MNVLMMNRYGRLGASSRVRSLQFIGALADRGVAVETDALVSDEDLLESYAGRRRRWRVLRSYSERIFTLLGRARRADLIWMEKELLPFLPYWIEAALLPSRKPLLLDFDDAIFHNYDLHRSALVRWLLGDKIDRLMRRADVVVVGNDYLAARARQAGARRVVVVPSVVDMAIYDAAGPHVDDGLTIGWIGSPSTYRAFIAPMLPMLKRVAARHGARVMLVGAGPNVRSEPGIDVFPWSEDSEQDMLLRMSIGIMPLESTPWAEGKCGYKLIQYMAAKMPVVASPVGVNADIVRVAETGFLAVTESEWETALSTLLSDSALRSRMSVAGHQLATSDYSLQRWAPEIADLVVSFSPNSELT